MKVLLINTYKLLWRPVSQSVLIWFLTGITGCTVVLAVFFPQSYDLFFSESYNIELYGLSLLFSSPAIAIAIPVLYFLPRIQSTFARVGFAILSILATCGAIIGCLVITSGDREFSEFIVVTLSPFVPSAIIWFFLIAGKQTLNPMNTKWYFLQQRENIINN